MFWSHKQIVFIHLSCDKGSPCTRFNKLAKLGSVRKIEISSWIEFYEHDLKIHTNCVVIGHLKQGSTYQLQFSQHQQGNVDFVVGFQLLTILSDFPIHSLDNVISGDQIIRYSPCCQEIHPYSATNIDSVKINTSMIMMRKCQSYEIICCESFHPSVTP